MNNKMRFEFVRSMGSCARNEFILTEFVLDKRNEDTTTVAEIERFFVISLKNFDGGEALKEDTRCIMIGIHFQFGICTGARLKEQTCNRIEFSKYCNFEKLFSPGMISTCWKRIRAVKMIFLRTGYISDPDAKSSHSRRHGWALHELTIMRMHSTDERAISLLG